MQTYYEIIEGDHWKFVSRHDDLAEADAECARLNALDNRGYFVEMVKDGERFRRVQRWDDDE